MTPNKDTLEKIDEILVLLVHGAGALELMKINPETYNAFAQGKEMNEARTALYKLCLGEQLDELRRADKVVINHYSDSTPAGIHTSFNMRTNYLQALIDGDNKGKENI